MDQIKRQFGAVFAAALVKCPTLVADLKEIREKGVKIRKVGGHCQAYSNRDKRTIYIGSKCGLSYQLISLAHEKVHVLVSLTPDPIPGKTGRQAFIDMCLNAETDAIVHEVQVTGELIGAGIFVGKHSLTWYRRYRKGGRAAIRKAMENAVTSNTGEKYPDYYGLWYDEVVKPKDRLPFHRLFGAGTRGGGSSCPPRPPLRFIGQLSAGDDPCPRFRCSHCEPTVHLTLPALGTADNKD